MIDQQEFNILNQLNSGNFPSEEQQNCYLTILKSISTNGKVIYDWNILKHYMKWNFTKWCEILPHKSTMIKTDDGIINVEIYCFNLIQEISHLIMDFMTPPFTIQRISELLLDPVPYHASLETYLVCIEKLFRVTHTVDVVNGPIIVPSPKKIIIRNTSALLSTENDPISKCENPTKEQSQHQTSIDLESNKSNNADTVSCSENYVIPDPLYPTKRTSEESDWNEISAKKSTTDDPE